MNKKHWLLGHKGTRGTAHMSAGKSARGIILVVLLLVLSFLSDATMNTRAIEHDEDARLQEFEMWDAEKLKLTADAFLFGEADGIKYESHAEDRIKRRAKAFAGYLYESKQLHIFVTDDLVADELEERLVSFPKQAYTVNHVNYDFDTLTGMVSEARQRYGGIDAGVDVANNGLYVGLSAKEWVIKQPEATTLNGVPVRFEQSLLEGAVPLNYDPMNDPQILAQMDRQEQLFLLKMRVDTILDELDGFGGYALVNDKLYIAVTTELSVRQIQEVLADASVEDYFVQKVEFTYSQLEAALRPAMKLYGASEGSVDVINNALKFGFDDDNPSLYLEELYYLNIPISTYKSVPSEPLKNRKPVTLRELLGEPAIADEADTIEPSADPVYELWGGDALGDSQSIAGTLTINGTWNGMPAILTAGHLFGANRTSVYYYDTDSVRRMFIGSNLYAHASNWDHTTRAGDYAVIQRVNGKGTNRIITGVDPVRSTAITHVADARDLIVGGSLWRYGQRTKTMSLGTIISHGEVSIGGKSMMVVLIEHESGQKAKRGDSGGPVWFSLSGGNYLSGLISGGKNSVVDPYENPLDPDYEHVLVYPMYSFSQATDNQFKFQVTP